MVLSLVTLGSTAGMSNVATGIDTAYGKISTILAAYVAGNAASPGQSGSAPGQSGNTPGQSGNTPGQNGSAPPGQSGNNPGHGH
jgi:hypothetical protein